MLIPSVAFIGILRGKLDMNVGFRLLRLENISVAELLALQTIRRPPNAHYESLKSIVEI